MQGKVVVITGATSGIGLVAAQRLAAMGARIVMVARDKGRAEAALAGLPKSAGGAHTVHYADLTRLSEMKRVAGEIATAEPKIDVLMNNAGALFGSRIVTEDGLETTFALNHMSYFVVAHGLRERLVSTKGARVVNTASDAHEGAKLDFNDLQSANGYRGFKVYSRSKLCNILFTRELARRLQGTGVTANSLHPGFVNTRFGDESGGMLSVGVRIAKNFAISVDKGAETMVYLASSNEVANVSGAYFYKCKAATPSKEAQDDQAAARLWEESERIVETGNRQKPYH